MLNVIRVSPPPEVAPQFVRRLGQRMARTGTEKSRRFNRNALIRAGDRRDRHTGDRIVGSAAV